MIMIVLVDVMKIVIVIMIVGHCHICNVAGAIAFSLIEAINQGHGDTYSKVARAMRYALKNGPQDFEALPELSSSHTFDLNRPFVL